MHSGVVSAATVERLAVIAAVQVGRAHAAPTVVVVAVAVADLSYAPNYIARDSWPSASGVLMGRSASGFR